MYRAAVGIVPSLLFFLVSICAQDGIANEERQWTDSTGRFQVKAKLIQQDGRQVVLKTSDGRTIKIPIDRLSQANQVYLQQLKTDAANKPKPLPTESKPAAPETPVDPQQSLDAAPRLDFSKEVWNVDVSASKPSSIKPVDITLPKPQGRRQPHAANGLLLMAAVSDVSGTGPAAKTRLLIANFRTDELTELPPETGTAMHPVAILGDAETIVMVGTGKDTQTTAENLQSWQVKNGSLQRGDIWSPYAGKSNGGIRFAAAGPNNSLLTCSKGGHIVAWEMPSKRAIWQIEMGSPPYWHTTVDQTRLAIASASQLVIVDLPSGQVIGSQPLRELGRISYPKLSFNPSEDKLYLSSIGRVLILDLQSNQWIQDTNVSGVGTSNGAIFCDDQHVLIDGSTLVDWKSGEKVDTYRGLGAPLQAGHFTFVVSDTQLRALDLPLAQTADPSIDLKTTPNPIAMNSNDQGKQSFDLVGRWQIAAEDSYGSGNIGKSRSTYRFAKDGTYEVYSTLTVVNAATNKQLYSVTSREQGTWTLQKNELCLTEIGSELIDFQSTVPAVNRQTFEAAIAEKTPPITYTIVSQIGKTTKLREAKSHSTMVLQRVD